MMWLRTASSDCCSWRSSGRLVVAGALARRKCAATKVAIVMADTARTMTTVAHDQAAAEVLQAAIKWLLQLQQARPHAKFCPEHREKAMLADVDEECALM
jgi:hypothetical protein